MPDNSRIPVDRGWAWVIAFAYFVGVFCMVGIAKSFGILLPHFVAYFNVPVALAALIMGVSGAVYTVAAPICVTAGQHFTQRRVVMLGGVIGALGLTLSNFLFSIEWVILTFGALYGFGNACLFGNGLVMLGQYFSKYRSLANGLSLTGSSVGQFVMSPLLQYLLDTYQLRGTLLIIGAIYLHVVVCGSLFTPVSFYTSASRRPRKKDQTPEELELVAKVKSWEPNQIVTSSAENEKSAFENDNDFQNLEKERLSGNGESDSLRRRTASHDSTENTDESDKSCNASCVNFIMGLLDFRVLTNVIVLLYVLVSFLVFFGYFNFIMFMPSSAESKGVVKYNRAYLVSIAGISDLVGRIVVGIAGDLHFVARYKIMAVAVFLCGLSVLAFDFVESYWALALFVGCYGFLGGCYVVVNTPVLIDMVGMQLLPKALGVVLFIQGIGAAIGQPVLGMY
ncbi:hypothetical protein ACF0H5_020348 [Mactra antiquata]